MVSCSLTEPGSGRTDGAGKVIASTRRVVQAGFILGFRLFFAQWLSHGLLLETTPCTVAQKKINAVDTNNLPVGEEIGSRGLHLD